MERDDARIRITVEFYVRVGEELTTDVVHYMVSADLTYQESDRSHGYDENGG